jgi:hypothetical protein
MALSDGDPVDITTEADNARKELKEFVDKSLKPPDLIKKKMAACMGSIAKDQCDFVSTEFDIDAKILTSLGQQTLVFHPLFRSCYCWESLDFRYEWYFSYLQRPKARRRAVRDYKLFGLVVREGTRWL